MTQVTLEMLSPVNVMQQSEIRPIHQVKQPHGTVFSNIFITIIIMKIQLSLLKHINRNVYINSD